MPDGAPPAPPHPALRAAADGDQRVNKPLQFTPVAGRASGSEEVAPKADGRGKLTKIPVVIAPGEAATKAVANTLEGLILSRNGGVAVLGWVDDQSDPIDAIEVTGADWKVIFDGPSLARIRREDVENSLKSSEAFAYGYFGLVFGDTPISIGEKCAIEIRFVSGNNVSANFKPRIVDAETLRNTALSYIHSARYFGNSVVKATGLLEAGLGEEILSLNRSIVSKITASPYVERFGRQRSSYDATIIVCLYGKPEYFFLQCALYADLPGMERYEFVFVSNSPELSEVLLEEAKIAALTYDISLILVILPGNAGFGAANNIAAKYARSNRLLIVNPDVFPKDREWAVRHSEIVRTRPAEETRIFGAPLYYDNGSLMHGGMYFELDQGCAFDRDRSVTWRLFRVEHYGKGAPPETEIYTRARPVSAVTGAFISIARDWFETLGGFSVDYVFGHYEDADLSLKSIRAGVAPWIHDVRMWHFEGKGATRAPVHEGGSLVNRWVFSSRWGGAISDGLLGPAPSHRLLKPKGLVRG